MSDERPGRPALPTAREELRDARIEIERLRAEVARLTALLSEAAADRDAQMARATRFAAERNEERAAHELEKRAHERTWALKAQAQDRLALAMAWGAEACADAAWMMAALRMAHGAQDHHCARTEAAELEVARLTAALDDARASLDLSVRAWDAAGMQGRSAHDAIEAARDEGAAEMRGRAVAVLREIAGVIAALPLRRPT